MRYSEHCPKDTFLQGTSFTTLTKEAQILTPVIKLKVFHQYLSVGMDLFELMQDLPGTPCL